MIATVFIWPSFGCLYLIDPPEQREGEASYTGVNVTTTVAVYGHYVKSQAASKMSMKSVSAMRLLIC